MPASISDKWTPSALLCDDLGNDCLLCPVNIYHGINKDNHCKMPESIKMLRQGGKRKEDSLVYKRSIA
jgi:hypothetical protein